MTMLLAAATDPCGDERRVWLCHWVTSWTDNRTAADIARWVSPWLSLLLITLVAVIVNRIGRRLVRRSASRWERGGRLLRWQRTPMRALEPISPVTAERRHQRAETIGAGLSSFFTIGIWLIAIVWMLAVLGVDTATLLTSAGLIGVALAFGAQNLLRDLISGTFIIFEDQLGVGDVAVPGPPDQRGGGRRAVPGGPAGAGGVSVMTRPRSSITCTATAQDDGRNSGALTSAGEAETGAGTQVV